MHLHKVEIENFKSLRNITMYPEPLTIISGPNGSGKSNFADSLSFFSDIYKNGLEIAVAKKGGYENIAFRRQRRSSAPIKFTVVADESPENIPNVISRRLISNALNEKPTKPDSIKTYRFEHNFSFKAQTENISAPFYVQHETIKLSFGFDTSSGIIFETAISLKRDKMGQIKIETINRDLLPEHQAKRLRQLLNAWSNDDEGGRTESNQLLTEIPFLRFPLFRWFTRSLGSMFIHRLSPDTVREPGVPTPNPEMSVRGQNLPAVIEWIKKTNKKGWNEILTAMKQVLPTLTDIEIAHLHTKTLGLFFKEQGIGKAWPAEDISDGTIQALGLFSACADQRASALIIEEPENSVHPWVILSILSVLRTASLTKQVIITTHSPIILDSIHPDSLFLCYKKSVETHLTKAVEIDPDLKTSWENGEFKLYDYLGSGLMLEAVPGGPQ